MRLIILAAGYATRLYPLTLDQPKPLLTVGGRPIIERVIESLRHVGSIHQVYVVTNAKFAGHFERWAAGYRAKDVSANLVIVDDNSTDESNKLGAIGDLQFVLESERIDDDIVVAAGDNLFSQSLEGFGDFALSKNAPVLAVYEVGSLSEVTKYNSIEVDDEGRIIFFEEKPQHPTSTLTGVALYYYPKSTLPLIKQYLAEGNNPDQPGRLVQWMYRRTPFYTWRVPGIWYDIGSKETLQEADRIFSAKPASGLM